MAGENEIRVKSVAIIGAGAAGAVTAAAFKAEDYFEHIRVFERRETAGGTWIYDADPPPGPPIQPGSLAGEVDPPLEIPANLPRIAPPNQQERYSQTPVYASVTTNVPDIAMSFSDARFAYGPFAPHYIPRQYIENYFSAHKTDALLVLNTTLEDLSQIPPPEKGAPNKWKLTLRKYDPAQHVDVWWEEVFDAVVLANGHYSVPYVPDVKGLEEYSAKFPGRVIHSKLYRSPHPYKSKKVVIIGNSASGHDLSEELVSAAHLPVYQSRRSASRWDGDAPPAGIEWKPIIKEYQLDGRIIFDDDTYLDGVDTVIYCTGYQASFPFWNAKANGRPLWDYAAGKLVGAYWHTFFRAFPTLGVIGVPRTLTFRSFEYQGIALARLWSGRNAQPLPSDEEQERWEAERAERTRRGKKKFHDIPWDDGETFEWLDGLFRIAGLGTLKGEGRIPPALGADLIWAVEHIRKYPEPGKGSDGDSSDKEDASGALVKVGDEEADSEWVLVRRSVKDSLAFI
ncbi:hypothetical protein B0T25DRAFT_27058 [Lasiosphaeria hispida]|uniref:Thiol-specific monooxygenase n=1 Tax=Lasiosphaeria hispida TaxID=260671 RepID=A0AAJ0MJQ4_9PEZI|nr:hypothetical protein B0T25DRAFT_27058 [Lasiosphaeria hispida]